MKAAAMTCLGFVNETTRSKFCFTDEIDVVCECLGIDAVERAKIEEAGSLQSYFRKSSLVAGFEGDEFEGGRWEGDWVEEA
jgi:hypothetical protein